MTDPTDPHSSIPTLTDVIVPGRPPTGRPVPSQPDANAAMQPSTQPEQPAFAWERESKPTAPTHGVTPPEAAVASSEQAGSRAAAFDERDVEFIAERLRSRFSAYLRQDARSVVEGRCRDAVEEHTNWLVRQVTREVVSALEQEVAGWVRDAVREELARHASRR